MKHPNLKGTLISAAALALVALGAGPAIARDNPVAVSDNTPFFLPTQLSINVGDTVTWTNQSPDSMHTVTMVALAASPGDPVPTLSFGGLFDKRDLLPGQTFRVKFDTPGIFPYTCLIHPWFAGSISVSLPGAPLGAGPLFDILQGPDTPDMPTPIANGFSPGIGEVCTTATYETPPGKVPGVIHCADAKSFQDLSLSAFDQNPTASIRKVSLPCGNRMIGGRFEGAFTTHNLWFDKTGCKMFATQLHAGKLMVYDRKTNNQSPFVITTLPAGNNTHVMTTPNGVVGMSTMEGGVNPDGSVSGHIALFDAQNPAPTVTNYINTGSDLPHGFWICGDGKHLVAPAPLQNKVVFMTVPATPNGVGTKDTATPSVGIYPVAVGTLQNCTKTYVTNAVDHTVGVYDPVTGGFLHNVDLGVCTTCTLMGTPVPTIHSPIQVPPSPDGRYVVALLSKAARIAVIDTSSDTVVATTDCGNGCHGGTFVPKQGGGYYHVASVAYQDKMMVLDMDTLQLAGQITTNARSTVKLAGLDSTTCPTCPSVAEGVGWNSGIIGFPLSPPWIQPTMTQ
ncbi:hypothetical protein [Nitrospira sp. Nam80]